MGGREHLRRVRVRFESADERFLRVRPVEGESAEECWQVRYDVSGVNDEFTDGVAEFWKGAQLNLLDVEQNEDGTYTPSFIVLEPNYLLDISSLAECYRDYGAHPLNYVMSRLVPTDNGGALLLGNIANLFLDEWIHSGEEGADYQTCMKKAFRRYPVELSVCEDLTDEEKSKAFGKSCRMHFEHLHETVQYTFRQSEYALDKADAVLEPSYICEALGIQGRLDYMQRDMSAFIEMKAGKADEYASPGKVVPRENHRVQMLLYMAVLEYSMGIDHRRQHPYLLYTRYPLLYPARVSWAKVRSIIALRNRIVAMDYGVQLHNSPDYTERLLAQIRPQTLNVKKKDNPLWRRFLAPSILRFRERLDSLDTLEKAYFHSLYNFITKELYTSKAGEVEREGRMGAAALWLAPLEEKREAGEILCDLRLTENLASDLLAPFVTLSLPVCDDELFLPNFRLGDAVVLYERNLPTDNVTNKLVFKGSIERMTEAEVCIRLRSAQRNLSVFPTDSRYAMEHDAMDTTFRSMYLGLAAFLDANPERRALLLGRREPLFDAKNAHFIDDFDRVAERAVAARDYFLLVGPPGTGKTSRALRRMVERFYAQPDAQLLLLAYTNRAVDEICQSLSAITPEVDYVRVGGELSCDVRFRGHLMANVLTDCHTRAAVSERLARYRIYVGTVASVSLHPELFKLKRFDVAIVDEATQILEPQLLGILCARVKDGRNAVGKFVLIGDHKQLPAIVLQPKEQSEVHDEGLRGIGLTNLRDSLFERLYRRHLQQPHSEAVDMLCRQGRMHPTVAAFPNAAFYGGRLEAVGLPHQLEDIPSSVVFLPSEVDDSSPMGKTNRFEARMVADCAAQIYEEYGAGFVPGRTLGIITPYRSQIALIRKELQAKGIPQLTEVSVDTVERYQGSEREVIVYSFCVNRPSQLDFLPNLTEENGVLIDRKLNVALTRARRRTILTGVPHLLRQDPIFRRLLEAVGGRPV